MRCCVFVCSQLQYTAQFVFITASGLLVHKILLHSVLLSPIVSGSVRPKLPGQTPLAHNRRCFLPLEGRLGSGPRLVGRIGSGVRVSVSFQQKYPPGSVLRQKIAIFTYCSPHFGFPWRRPCDYHAICCMDGKRIPCLQIFGNIFSPYRSPIIPALPPSNIFTKF